MARQSSQPVLYDFAHSTSWVVPAHWSGVALVLVEIYVPRGVTPTRLYWRAMTFNIHVMYTAGRRCTRDQVIVGCTTRQTKVPLSQRSVAVLCVCMCVCTAPDIGPPDCGCTIRMTLDERAGVGYIYFVYI